MVSIIEGDVSYLFGRSTRRIRKLLDLHTVEFFQQSLLRDFDEDAKIKLVSNFYRKVLFEIPRASNPFLQFRYELCGSVLGLAGRKS